MWGARNAKCCASLELAIERPVLVPVSSFQYSKMYDDDTCNDDDDDDIA